MTLQELIAKCQQQIDLHGDNAEVMLILRGRWGKRDYKTLLGVRGEIVQEFPQNQIGVFFPAQRLMSAEQRELKKGGAENAEKNC